MTKTIEFIEKEINRLEVAINVYYEDLYQEVNSYSDDCPEKKEILLQIKEEVKEIENKLQTLKQIKCELEAWEELNKTFEIGVEKQIEEIYIKGKNYYGNEKTIWGYSKEGALKVKKALEVGDE